MKIRIDDEYSNFGEDFNIVLNECSQNNFTEGGRDNFDCEKDYYCNETFDNSAFNVEVQYTEKINYESMQKDESEVCESNYKEEGFSCKNSSEFDENEQYFNNEVTDYMDSINKPCNNDFEKSFISDVSENRTPYDCLDNVINKHSIPSEKDYFNSCEDDYKESYEEKCRKNKGVIKVLVKLDAANGIEIKGAKINLYELNGVCPRLYESKLTDCNGFVIFDNLDNACYRVISIVDRKFFEKPSYIKWNEVTIDDCNKYADVVVINKIKQSCYKR